MPDRKKLQQYCSLLVESINLKEGQELVIRIPAEHLEFARLLQKMAYEKGAGLVTVRFEDDYCTRNSLLYAGEEVLSRVTESELLRNREEQERCTAYMSILSDHPDAMEGVDEEKSGRILRARSLGLKPVREYLMKSQGQWSVAAIPNPGWARQVFPEIEDEEAAVEALYDAIFETVGMNKPGDPLENWRNHGDAIHSHSQKMTEYQFQAIRFHNSIGTDLLVPLVKNHIWGGGMEPASRNGQWFDPNIPTEEIFTCPDCRKTEGTVKASRPLNMDGQMIEDFGFTFHEGKVTDWHAGKGAKTLESILSADEGAVRIGEVALVPYDSPISNLNLLFYNTLFDENAACHLALGASYPTTVKGGEAMDGEELLNLGANQSAVHVDFMFGTEDLSADGIREDGTVVPIFRNGNFVI